MTFIESLRPTRNQIALTLLFSMFIFFYLFILISECTLVYDVIYPRSFCRFFEPLESIIDHPFILFEVSDKFAVIPDSLIWVATITAYLIELYLLSSIIRFIYSKLKKA